MTQPSNAPVSDASVVASTEVTLIKIDVMIEHRGHPDDLVSVHESFFDALDGEQYSLFTIRHI